MFFSKYSHQFISSIIKEIYSKCNYPLINISSQTEVIVELQIYIENQMIEQFQNILNEPRYSSEQILQSTRNLILNTLESTFPPDFNFDGLSTLCNDASISNNPALLTYHMVDYFIQLMQANFVSIYSYEALEGQTQKLETTIRSHIRLEQEVKMYLEHLEGKLVKYENYLRHTQKEGIYQSNDTIPSQQETQLRKQRVSLVRTNQKLKRQLQQRNQQLKEKDNQLSQKKHELSHLKTDPIESGQLLKRSVKLLNAKSEQRLQVVTKVLNQSLQKEGKVQGVGPSEKQAEGFLINISGNNNEFNYYVGKK